MSPYLLFGLPFPGLTTPAKHVTGRGSPGAKASAPLAIGCTSLTREDPGCRRSQKANRLRQTTLRFALLLVCSPRAFRVWPGQETARVVGRPRVATFLLATLEPRHPQRKRRAGSHGWLSATPAGEGR